MSVLDNLKDYQSVDKENLLKQVEELPMQFENAHNEVQKVVLPSYFTKVDKIVMLGIGGSAIAADLTKCLIERKSSIPVIVCRDYNLPGSIDRNSLVIGNSYSGNTEETLETIRQAIQKRAKLVAISTGGEIADMARQYKFPIYLYNYPSEPRQALGYSFGGILGILNKLALIDIKENEWKETVSTLKEIQKKINPEVVTSENQAKQLAINLHEKIIVTMASGYLSTVAQRFKTQLNENAKTMAFWEVLPEACHNFIIGLDFPENIHQNLFILMLSSKYDHQRVIVRRKAISEIFKRSNIAFDEIQMDLPKSILSEMLSFVYLLDFTSYYLSILNKVDPSPIENIKFLKKRLEEAKWQK